MEECQVKYNIIMLKIFCFFSNLKIKLKMIGIRIFLISIALKINILSTDIN